MTAEEFFEKKFGNQLKANDSWVIRFAEEYAKSQVIKYSLQNMEFKTGTEHEKHIKEWLKNNEL